MKNITKLENGLGNSLSIPCPLSGIHHTVDATVYELYFSTPENLLLKPSLVHPVLTLSDENFITWGRQTSTKRAYAQCTTISYMSALRKLVQSKILKTIARKIPNHKREATPSNIKYWSDCNILLDAILLLPTKEQTKLYPAISTPTTSPEKLDILNLLKLAHVVGVDNGALTVRRMSILDTLSSNTDATLDDLMHDSSYRLTSPTLSTVAKIGSTADRIKLLAEAITDSKELNDMGDGKIVRILLKDVTKKMITDTTVNVSVIQVILDNWDCIRTQLHSEYRSILSVWLETFITHQTKPHLIGQRTTVHASASAIAIDLLRSMESLDAGIPELADLMPTKVEVEAVGLGSSGGGFGSGFGSGGAL